ncbi:L,D-transpeptidase [Novosphingobium huizhouense]|uniref:L,D-transpeptidase n=1 Tax=Novosphingobium huizhouense TaxID=2866625 RepID=UPI001CD85D8E|nr:L,D-transpeptidase [Novosphingobium huizhouense]
MSHASLLRRAAASLPITIALAIAPGAAVAQGRQTSSPVEFARQAEALSPGEWVWAENIAPAGPVLVYVDVARQIATVYRNGVRFAVSTVSTGKKGYATPTGVFTILQKDKNHHSSKYNNAPMYYQQRLTWDGVALHAGGLPGYPESHGCVHLPIEFAKLLFGATQMGGTVIVSGSAGVVSSAAEASVLSDIDHAGQPAEHVALAGGEPWRWEPQKSPSGPLSLIVSRADQRVIVLRNGREIGRARITMPDASDETHVYTFSGIVEGKYLWTVAGVPGHGQSPGDRVQPWLAERIAIPGEFLTRVRSQLQPGASILVTDAPVLKSNSGRRMTVLASAADK